MAISWTFGINRKYQTEQENTKGKQAKKGKFEVFIQVINLYRDTKLIGRYISFQYVRDDCFKLRTVKLRRKLFLAKSETVKEFVTLVLNFWRTY